MQTSEYQLLLAASAEAVGRLEAAHNEAQKADYNQASTQAYAEAISHLLGVQEKLNDHLTRRLRLRGRAHG